MMSRNQRLSFLGIAAVIAVVAIIVLTAGGGSDEDGQDSADTATTATPSAAGEESTPTPTPTPTPKPQPPLLVAGKVAKLRFKEGDTVRFRVRHDAPEHIHVHGYDIMKDVEAGGTISFDFPANLEGVFEAELEGRKEQIIELTVNP